MQLGRITEVEVLSNVNWSVNIAIFHIVAHGQYESGQNRHRSTMWPVIRAWYQGCLSLIGSK